MPTALRRAERLDPETFLAWCAESADPDGPRFELVDGAPVQMMAGASERHDAIVVNLIVQLGQRLKPPCAPRTADQAILTRADRVRRPDVIVDCGPRPPRGLFAPNPVALFEVLSPSTANETLTKLDEYRTLASVRHVVVLDQDRATLVHHRRDADGSWRTLEVEGLHATLTLDALEVDLAMADVYRGVDLEG